MRLGMAGRSPISRRAGKIAPDVNSGRAWVDLGLGYGWKWRAVQYRATINLENATDELLFGDNNQNDRYGMLAQRTWRFVLRAQF